MIFSSFFESNWARSILLMLLFSSCIFTENKTFENKNSKTNTSTLKYAKGFNLYETETETKITVKNPWQYASNIEFTYILSQTKGQEPQIKTPVKKVICLSTTHLSYISQLGEETSVIGITNSNLVSNAVIQHQISDKSTLDIGNEQALNYELILHLKPDVIFAYGVGAEVQSIYQKFHEWGIPVVIVSEYLENSPLAKTEWIKFFATFYQKQPLADSIFESISNNYIQLSNLVSKVEKRPKIMSSLPWKDVWYVPGGNSFMAKYINDAGGEYLWANDTSRESLPLSMEHVFYKAREAEIWINTGLVNSLTDIANADPRMVNLKPYINETIYNNNLRLNPQMGNDFWESGCMNPHLILSDLIQIFHPECLSGQPFYYYQKLK